MESKADSNGGLTVQYFILLQLAQDEMVMLYNCPDVRMYSGRGYYYDVVDEFNRGWKRLNRNVGKGMYQQYRDAFCTAADMMSGEVGALRAHFLERCGDMFENGHELLSHLVTAKFMLRAADRIFSRMIGDGTMRSRLVANIIGTIDRFASKFRVRGKGKGVVIDPDDGIVRAFNDSLERAAMAI